MDASALKTLVNAQTFIQSFIPHHTTVIRALSGNELTWNEMEMATITQLLAQFLHPSVLLTINFK